MAKFELYAAIAQSAPVMSRFAEVWDWENTDTKLLFTYAYPASIEWLDRGIYERIPMSPKKIMLDSGAFTAWNIGKELMVEEYIDYIKRKRDEGREFDEVIGLDRVGDPEYTLRNCRAMKKALGHEVIPVFHIGEDLKWLKIYCKEFEKVGLSCRFGEPVKASYHFYEECFHAVWPHKYHSFGWTSEKMLESFPFQSADATSFLLAGPRYGRWKSLQSRSKDARQMRIGGPESYVGIVGELKIAQRMERKLQGLWSQTLESL